MVRVGMTKNVTGMYQEESDMRQTGAWQFKFKVPQESPFGTEVWFVADSLEEATSLAREYIAEHETSADITWISTESRPVFIQGE